MRKRKHSLVIALRWKEIGSYTTTDPSWEASASHLLRNLLGTSVHGYGVYFTEWGRYNHLKHQLAYVQVWYNNRWQFTCWLTGLPGTSLHLMWQHKTQGWESGRGHSPLLVGMFNWKGWVEPPYIQLLVSWIRIFLINLVWFGHFLEWRITIIDRFDLSWISSTKL